MQRVRVPVPGPEHDPPPSFSPPQSAQPPPSATRAEFVSAIKLVREVIGEGRRLTVGLAQSYERVRAWREKWSWSPLSSDAYDSPPPYTPPHALSSRSTNAVSTSHTVRSSAQSMSPTLETIPHPPIPGDPFPTFEALIESANAFAKANGFGVTKYNGYSYKGRRIRYTLRCDRFGDPKPSRGAGLRQRKSRKCGCKWMVIAEALEEGRWLLREHANPEHG
ncbi:hypothetical protein VDGL01_10504 [Verticillium dahliae]